MSTERKQILDMLAQGKITAEEAERLLDKIGASGAGGGDDAAGPSDGETPKKGNPRFLCIQVHDKGGKLANVRLPLSFVRAGIKLHTILPKDASRKLEERGIDLCHLSSLHGEELTEALRELNIDVDSSDGERVRICCE